MIVTKTSVFPSSRNEIFNKLQKLKTLQYIASPYASFEPVGNTEQIWKEGSTSSYKFRLFGFIPFGTHTMHIIRFDEEQVSSHEGNEHVPVWNHDITMKPLDESHTEYTDQVEIKAGWKTIFIWIWANVFYAHRQKKWIQLLSKNTKEEQRS